MEKQALLVPMEKQVLTDQQVLMERLVSRVPPELLGQLDHMGTRVLLVPQVLMGQPVKLVLMVLLVQRVK